MEIAKPTDADRDWFRSLVPADPRVEIKPMFGNLGAFVNGNMFLGLFGSDVGLRLAASDLDGLTALGGGPFGPAGRPMGGYVSLPAWRGKPAMNTTWVGKALEHAARCLPKHRRSARVQHAAGNPPGPLGGTLAPLPPRARVRSRQRCQRPRGYRRTRARPALRIAARTALTGGGRGREQAVRKPGGTCSGCHVRDRPTPGVRWHVVPGWLRVWGGLGWSGQRTEERCGHPGRIVRFETPGRSGDPAKWDGGSCDEVRDDGHEAVERGDFGRSSVGSGRVQEPGRAPGLVAGGVQTEVEQVAAAHGGHFPGPVGHPVEVTDDVVVRVVQDGVDAVEVRPDRGQIARLTHQVNNGLREIEVHVCVDAEQQVLYDEQAGISGHRERRPPACWCCSRAIAGIEVARSEPLNERSHSLAVGEPSSCRVFHDPLGHSAVQGREVATGITGRKGGSA